MTSYKKILGPYANDYNDITLKEETNTGLIYIGTNIKYNRNCALKVINKNQLKLGDYDYLLNQINISEEINKLCQSENIVDLYQRLETEDYIIFELEYCDTDLKEYFLENGELEKNKDFFKKIIISLAKALKIINKKGVMHRDIKPNNIFMTSSDDEIIKLGDFGCSIYIKDNTSDPIGTILYAAPEILKNMEYDEKCDLWSLGATLYELFFGVLPYGFNPNTNEIMNIIYDEQNFRLKKTHIPTLDILFYKLLTINPEKRMSLDEFFKFVENKDFMKEDVVYDEYQKLYKDILKIEDVKYIIPVKKEHHNKKEEDQENATKIVTYVKGGHLPDVMNFSNGSIEGQKFNNILYYDENISDYLKEINKDSDLFERCTPGAFILCTNIDSLKLIRTEILNQIKKDKRATFNLITTGSTCEKIMNFLKEDINFENCIKNACVYCRNLKEWSPLKDKYKKIYNVCNMQKDVINFINKFSSTEIKAFPITKLLTYQDYLDKYKERHITISQFYGDLTPESYKKNIEEMKLLVKKEKDANELKIKDQDQNKLLEGFYTFDIKEDIETLDKLIIHEYTKNTFYGDLNKWLMSSKMNSFETVAYFTARLMYSLNSYGESNGKYYEINKEEVKRGIKLPFSCLLPYERAKGKVILLSSFTSTSLDEKQAKNFSGRNHTKTQYKTKLVFSVIYYIKNFYKKNWISNGVNIESISQFKTEKEILYQPFSFYYVRDVQINLSNYTADIYLETIGKVEILENKIKFGKSIVYNEKLKIMEVKD